MIRATLIQEGGCAGRILESYTSPASSADDMVLAV